MTHPAKEILAPSGPLLHTLLSNEPRSATEIVNNLRRYTIKEPFSTTLSEATDEFQPSPRSQRI